MNKKLLITFLSVFAVLFFSLSSCDKDEKKVSEAQEELLPVIPEIVFSDEAEEGGEITQDMIPPGALAEIEDNGTLNPNVQFVASRKAQSIRRIVKQDVYGRELSDDFYYYRKILSAAEKTLYDQMYANCFENDPTFKIQSRVKHDRAMPVLQAVLFDNPDLFWVEPSISYSYGNDGFITEVTIKFNETARNLDAFKKTFYDCADSVLEQAMKLENDVLKVKYIHDVLTYVNEYVLNAPLNQSAYSAIVNKRTVCAGYAKAFSYYMQRLGIPSLVIEGYAGENHAWNLVKLYGDYYEMDVTWNDPVGNPPNRFYYNYYNITTNEINRGRNRNRLSASNIPLAQGTRYSYPNFFGNSPGSNFNSLNYGRPSARLPHIYPDAGSQIASLPSTPASVRPEPSTASAQPSITLVNNTGYDIWWVYISLPDDESWGDDLLDDNEILDNGQSLTINLPYTISSVNRYDIMLEDSDGDGYYKMNTAVTDNARIVFTLADLGGGEAAANSTPMSPQSEAPPSMAPSPPSPVNTGASRESREYILNSMRQWNQCRSVALTQTQGNIAIYGRDGYSSMGVPSSLVDRLRQAINAREQIEDIHIAESGGWLLFTLNTVYWDGIDSNLDNKLREISRNNEKVITATFNTRGEWILITDKTYSSSSSDIQNWLTQGYNERGGIISVSITDDGVITSVHERGWRIRGSAPQALINALNSSNLDFKRIKICGTAWFFADNNGSYSCSI